MNNEWELIFVVPNLQIAAPVEFDEIALVPPDDKRLQEIKENDPTSKILLSRFSNQFGRVINPCAIILKNGAPDYFKNIGFITDFRNAVAICAIIGGHVFYGNRGGEQSSEAMYSDFFDLYPVSSGKDKDNHYLIAYTPLVLGLDDAEKFNGQVSPLIIYTHHRFAEVDKATLNLLFSLLREDPKKEPWRTVAIFRSLQIAYQASAIPFTNPFSMFDFGSKIALWVSAFEILIHPHGKRNVGLSDVLDLLEQHSFSKQNLKQRKFKWYHGRKGNKKISSLNLIQKIYHQLYSSRCAFLHGDLIKDIHMYPFGNKGMQPLLIFAPFIYKIALIEQLSKLGAKKRKRGKQLSETLIVDIMEETDFERSIMKCFDYRRSSA